MKTIIANTAKSYPTNKSVEMVRTTISLGNGEYTVCNWSFDYMTTDDLINGYMDESAKKISEEKILVKYANMSAGGVGRPQVIKTTRHNLLILIQNGEYRIED